MCPSYMATRDERDTTRGRANTLRLAMGGRLSDAGLDDEAVAGVLDLCLECRACKTECPVGVDVARFKSEFLAGYWKRRGLPLAKRALGQVHAIAKAGSRVAPLANAVAASAAGRWINETLFGIDRRRTLPLLARQTFTTQFNARERHAAARVVLFNDTFTNFYDPAIGVAAVGVLTAAGVSVRLAPHACCGRPLISTGQLDRARELAEANAKALSPMVTNGAEIIFLEPSCLSAIREDVPDLLRGDAQRQARQVAQSSLLFEEYVEREWTAGRLSLDLRPGPRTVLLHGHCHQKSMGLVPAARALLGRIPGSEIVDLDAGCCGMAGSFGYTRDHYEISRQIGERRLFPAARAMKPGDVLAAGGTSCRHQIAHFTGIGAQHPAVLLRDLIR
jgi:Fe-S oxidoreductase